MSDVKHSEHEKNTKRLYVKSEIPISSVEYRKILSDVSQKRQEVERKEAEIKLLKYELQNDWHALSNASATRAETSQITTTVSSPERSTANSASSTSVRTKIVTPGGTKRKVKQSYIKFKVDLQDTLRKFVSIKPDSCLAVDDLIERLYDTFPGVKGFERMHILRTVSKLYEKKIEYRGKRREGFYRGLSICEDTDLDITGNKLSAGPSKVKRGIAFETPDIIIDNMMDIKINDSSVEGVTFEALECLEDCNLNDMGIKMNKLSVEERQDPVTTEILQDQFRALQDSLCVTHDAARESMSSKHQDYYELSKKLDCVQHLLAKYERSAQRTIKKQEEVISLYKDIVGSGSLLGGLLSLTERKVINEEVKKVKTMFNLNMRTNTVIDLANVFDPFLFQNLVVRIKEECPTIANILEQLVLSPNASRNVIKTEEMKMKAAVHQLASLIDVRDQNGKNDIPILFGLLCLCYGAGYSMIGLLQHLGLSESYPVLIRILQKQLQNYKTIINKRVEDSKPVVTYQDNMQLMRTSMRHLRLSKLEKDKMKQGKVWDFTVRGWRECEITGLEDMFKNRLLATQPQREVKHLKYTDTKIENNPEHNKKWKAFKTRNMLRKLDIGLNDVNVSANELRSATSEQIEGYAAAKNLKTERKFKIEIPPVDDEFPDLGKKKTNIYPLPISHENQCKTLGVASNLQLFSDEFQFTCEQAKCYLPMRSSGDSFDLDKSYARYAFMKSLEKHKEQQAKYEQVLRREQEPDSQAQTGDSNEAQETSYMFVVESESSDSEA